jgi:hypothetical protein
MPHGITTGHFFYLKIAFIPTLSIILCFLNFNEILRLCCVNVKCATKESKMKKTSMTILLTALLSLSSSLRAEPITKVEITTSDESDAKRIYIGPEFMWSHFRGGLKTKWHDYCFKKNVYYGGIRLGYEYLKPEAYYLNTDAIIALGSEHKHIIKEKNDILRDKKIAYHVKKAVKGHRGHAWLNIEQRLGYTFASSLIPRCTISFYGAPGYHYEHIRKNIAQWWYLATGVKTLQQFGEGFLVGCDVKVMYAFGAHRHGNLILPVSLGNRSFWGYEFGTPLVWTLGECQRFDIELKPYILKLNTNSSETIFGARAEFGYKF